MSSAAGYPVSVFGWFDLPALVQKDMALREIFGEAHEIIAYALLALIIIHIAAAIYHHYYQGHKLINRMW
jgi:cytochrome b561